MLAGRATLIGNCVFAVASMWSSLASAATCDSQAKVLVGRWTQVTDQHLPECSKSYVISSNGSTYTYSNCPHADTYHTELLSAACEAGEFAGLTGAFFERDDGNGTWAKPLIYCNYWQRASSSSNLVWEWWWTEDLQAGCPATLAQARTKPVNGDLWKAGSNMSGTPTSTWACVGDCPTFACGCSTEVIPTPAAESCSSQVDVIQGRWSTVASQWNSDCDAFYTLSNTGSTYIRNKCPSAGTYNTELLGASCGAGASGGLYGMFSEADNGGGTWNNTYIYCNYWQKSSSSSNLVWKWFWTIDQQAGCPSTLAEARAKLPEGDVWKIGSSVPGTPTSELECMGTCPEFTCGCDSELSSASGPKFLACPLLACLFQWLALSD